MNLTGTPEPLDANGISFFDGTGRIKNFWNAFDPGDNADAANINGTFSASPVPEPVNAALAVSGFTFVSLALRRHKTRPKQG